MLGNTVLTRSWIICVFVLFNAQSNHPKYFQQPEHFERRKWQHGWICRKRCCLCVYVLRHPVIPTEVWCFRYDFGVLFNTLPQFRYDWMSFWGCSSPSKHPHATLRSLAGFVRNPFWTLARRCSIKSCKATSVDGSNHVQSKWPTQPPIQSWGRCWENPWDAGPLIINTMYVYIHLIDYIVCICWV